MKRTIVALGLGILVVALLGWGLTVRWPGVGTSEAAPLAPVKVAASATSLRNGGLGETDVQKVVATPTPLPDDPLALAYAEEQLFTQCQ